MGKYIKHNFYRVDEEIDKSTINNDTWGGDFDNREFDISNINTDVGKERAPDFITFSR